MMKEFHQREEDGGDPVPVAAVQVTSTVDDEVSEEEETDPLFLSSTRAWMENSRVLEKKLQHLGESRRQEELDLVHRYPSVFTDKPGRTNVAAHDIDVGDARPIKSSPYRIHPGQVLEVREELRRMEDQGIIEPATSEWCSPVTLVKKRDGSLRFCVDYRKVNKVTRKDTFPLPRVEDCVESIGNAKFITKIDCLRGFWQIPLTPRAQEISAFATLGRTWRFLVMPFGLCNAPATFQKLMADITADLPNCVAYLDDLVIYCDTWEEHLAQLEALFLTLSRARLVVNLAKSEFVCAQLQYLGHVIGLGTLAPPAAKCEDIKNMPPPTDRRQVRRFLGTVGYYRRYVRKLRGGSSSPYRLA